MSDYAKLEQIVTVDWIDSCGPRGWTDRADLDGYEPSRIVTVGYLVSESDTCIIVAGSQNYQRGGGQLDGVMCIPKVAIVSRGELPGLKVQADA